MFIFFSSNFKATFELSFILIPSYTTLNVPAPKSFIGLYFLKNINDNIFLSNSEFGSGIITLLLLLDNSCFIFKFFFVVKELYFGIGILLFNYIWFKSSFI